MPDHAAPFLESDALADPFALFARWFADAGAAGVREPEAAAIATATPDGRPSVRMVLVKRAGPEGFVFFTNYEGRKGRELEVNPHAALLWYWDVLGRQIRIEGEVVRTAAGETLEYLAVRPRGSRISALASPQSRPVPDRSWLEGRVAELTARHDGEELPVADDWGGFRLVPGSFEFWQNRRDRLHDRFLYTPLAGGGWHHERLAP